MVSGSSLLRQALSESISARPATPRRGDASQADRPRTEAPRRASAPPSPARLDVQVIRDCRVLPWHQHRHGYVAIVLDGRYEEAGDGGRRFAGPGDVLVHAPFAGHTNRFERSRATVVNIPVSLPAALRLASGTIREPEQVARELAANPDQAEHILAAAIRATSGEGELPDLLAADLLRTPGLSLTRWAGARGVPPRTLRRQFRLAYGLSPLAFRARAKARWAWLGILTTELGLSDLALGAGFADQAHMTRAVRSLTGSSPGSWRVAAGFKTGAGEPPY